MTTIERPTELDAYLAAVAAALTGVPEAERQDLLDDLADHLAELAAEDGEALADRLGPPDVYAAELLASAGIDVAAVEDEPVSSRRWITEAVARVRRSDALRAVLEFLPELRPGWWVVRAWAGLAILAAIADSGRTVFPLPDPFENVFVAIVALAAAIVGSVHLGRHGGWASKVLTVVGAIGVVVAITNGGPHTEYVDTSYGSGYYGGLTGPQGEYIQNIWPYDGEGNPLEGVLLFDQDGNPISVGDQSTTGVVIPGLFPQAQVIEEYDPMTGASRQVPVTAPVVAVPRLPGTTTSSTSTTTAPPTTTVPPG